MQAATWSETVGTDDYGQQRTETDNTDDRPAGVQNKPYLHKPRKRRYSSNYLTPAGRQPNDRRPNRRQAEPTTTTRLLGFSPTTGAQPAGTAQAQYRTAGRVLQARSEGSGLGSSTRAASAARHVPAKRDCAVDKKDGRPTRIRTSTK